jgi:hypothetical protein
VSCASNSTKGEIYFPIEDQLEPEDAFSRLTPRESTGLTSDEATSCGVCHDNEEPAPDYPFSGAFISAIVRPQPFFDVSIDSLKEERQLCDSDVEPERCAVLEALFDHGEVERAAFP